MTSSIPRRVALSNASIASPGPQIVLEVMPDVEKLVDDIEHDLWLRLDETDVGIGVVQSGKTVTERCSG